MATQCAPPVFTPLPVRRYYHQREDIPNRLLALTAVVPFTLRSTLPDRVEPRRWAQDFQQPNFQTQGIPAIALGTTQTRAPVMVPIFPRRIPTPDPVPNVLGSLYQISAPKPPIFNVPWPEIFRRNVGDILGMEDQSFLPGPGQLPFFSLDFPLPLRARQLPQDFTFSSTAIPPPAPFNQAEWPLHLKRPYFHQSYEYSGVTTRNIPAGIVAPFDLQDWPLPVRPKWAQADSQASPEVLLTTVVLRPFSQSDFPNPSPRRRPVDDWLWSGTTTRGITPVPPSSGPFAAVYLEGYGIGLDSIVLRWSASLGAAGYRLYINGVPQTQILTQRFIIVSGLLIDTQYVFNVVCVNAFGVDASILSNPVYFEHGSNEIGTYHTKPWN